MPEEFEKQHEDEIDEEGELSPEEAEERFLVFVQSATEITAAAVSNAGMHALSNPDQVAELFTKVFDAIAGL